MDRKLQRVLQMRGHNVLQSRKKSSFIWIVILILLVCIYFYYNSSSWDLVLDWIKSLN